MYLHVYQTKKGWTWSIYNRKRQVIAKSTRFYSRQSDATRAFQRLDEMF